MTKGADLRALRAGWSALNHLSPSLEPRPGGVYDRYVVHRHHRRVLGRAPDLSNPQTYIDKMAWQKLNHPNPLLPLCSDKVRVRDYVAHQGLGRLLVPDVEVFGSADEICWERLPERYVLKPNHGSQWVLFCRDRNQFNQQKASRRLSRWMRRNYSLRYSETNYRGIHRRILMEPYLGDLGAELQEHKFFCFHGEPKFISAVVGRDRAGVLRQVHDLDWNALAMTNRGVQRRHLEIARPACLYEMLEAARVLSDPFMHVRVDFFVVNGRPYVGELTFYDFGGVRPLEPLHLETEIGALWDLSVSGEVCRKGIDIAEKLALMRSPV